jgi:hypothetical protein
MVSTNFYEIWRFKWFSIIFKWINDFRKRKVMNSAGPESSPMSRLHGSRPAPSGRLKATRASPSPSNPATKAAHVALAARAWRERMGNGHCMRCTGRGIVTGGSPTVWMQRWSRIERPRGEGISPDKVVVQWQNSSQHGGIHRWWALGGSWRRWGRASTARRVEGGVRNPWYRRWRVHAWIATYDDGWHHGLAWILTRGLGLQRGPALGRGH